MALAGGSLGSAYCSVGTPDPWHSIVTDVPVPEGGGQHHRLCASVVLEKMTFSINITLFRAGYLCGIANPASIPRTLSGRPWRVA